MRKWFNTHINVYGWLCGEIELEHVQKHLANVDGLQRGCCGDGIFCAQSPSTDASDCNGVDWFGKFVVVFVSVVDLSEDVVAFVSAGDNNDWFLHDLLTIVWHWCECGALESFASFGWMVSLAMLCSGTSVTFWTISGWMIVSTGVSVSTVLCDASLISISLAISVWSGCLHSFWPNTTTLSPTATSSCFIWPLLVLYLLIMVLLAYTITQILIIIMGYLVLCYYDWYGLCCCFSIRQ